MPDFAFRTQYSVDKSNRRRTCPGTDKHQTYIGAYDDDGKVMLVPDKVVNTYDKIQSYRDSCDLNLLLKRYLAGDESCLQRVQGVYGDFATMPTDYASLLNRVSDGQRLFDSMSVEVKQAFGNSYEQFMVAMQRPDFWQRLNAAVGADTPVPGSNPKSEEVDSRES